MRNKILLLFLFVISFRISLAQNPTISGSVTEIRSGESITGISVILIPDTASNNKQRGALTNKFGFYSIPNITPGIYKLRVKAIGYAVYEKNIKILKDNNAKFDVKLELQDVKTQEITVEAEREATPTR
jgi:hypothetical protein